MDINMNWVVRWIETDGTIKTEVFASYEFAAALRDSLKHPTTVTWEDTSVNNLTTNP